MFCENCGNKIDSSHKFCTKCGQSVVIAEKILMAEQANPNDKWWHRLLKVLYVIAHIPLLIIIPVVWSINSSSYMGYFGGQYQYEDTYSKAFWYSLLTLVIYMIVVRLIRIAVLYVIIGQKPEWKQEFKKFF